MTLGYSKASCNGVHSPVLLVSGPVIGHGPSSSHPFRS